MLRHNVRAIPITALAAAGKRNAGVSDPRSIYGRIRDEFIILEEKERGQSQQKSVQVAFVYEEFMEYVMARALLRRWQLDGLNQQAILTEIDALTRKYDDFAQIIGVFVYLAIMLKEEQDLLLWSLLLHRGEARQKVVFESIRKLPEAQLDTGVFEALVEMLKGTDQVQVQVLDVLKVRRIGQAAPSFMVLRVADFMGRKQRLARRAVLALGNMRTDLVLPLLQTALQDRRNFVKKNAATALENLTVGHDINPVVHALQDNDW